MLRTFPGATTAAFDPAGRRVAVGRYRGVDLADPRTGRRVRTLRLPDVLPEGIVWVGDDLLVRTSDTGGRARVYDVALRSGRARPFTPLDDGVALAVSPDGRWVATSRRDGVVSIRARRPGHVDPTPVATFVADSTAPTGIAFDAAGTRLATSGTTTSAIWDVSRPDRPVRLEVLSDLPALARIPQPGSAPQLDPSAPAPSTPWGLVAFGRDGRTITLAGPSGVARLADDDPGLVCSLVTSADLAAAARTLGAPSACTRVAALASRRTVAGQRVDAAG